MKKIIEKVKSFTKKPTKKEEKLNLDDALRRAIKKGETELIWGEDIYFIEEA